MSWLEAGQVACLGGLAGSSIRASIGLVLRIDCIVETSEGTRKMNKWVEGSLGRNENEGREGPSQVEGARRRPCIIFW